jgi:hydrogenase-4 component F
MAFGKPDGGPAAPVQASILPMLAHLVLVLVAGVWLPGPLVAWFKNVAVLLG